MEYRKMSFRDDYRDLKGAKLIISSAQGKLKVEFPAFLTSLNNSFSSNWNEERVYGRQDPIGTFQGTSRKISLSFNIVSYDLEDAKKNLENINKITRMLYPSYSPVKTDDGSKNALVLSKAPLVYLQFGNLIQENDNSLLGWINSWSANPILDMGMFTPEMGKFFPKVYEASIDFTPQHKQNLAFNSGDGGNPIKFPYGG